MAEKMQAAFGAEHSNSQQGPGGNYVYSPVHSAPQVSQGSVPGQHFTPSSTDSIDPTKMTSQSSSPPQVTGGGMPGGQPPPPGFQPTINLPIEKMDVIPGYDSAIRGLCIRISLYV